jgi:tetratricopeptide (TPR) repeat protein
LAEALLEQGRLERLDWTDAASTETLHRAMIAAKAGRHGKVEAEALIALVDSAYDRNRLEEAREWAQQAGAALEGLGGDAGLQWRLESALGDLSNSQYHFGEALEHFERALALVQRYYGPKHWRVGQALEEVASDNIMLDREREALAGLRKALALKEATLGPDHPDVGTVLFSLGGLLCSIGQPEEGLALAKRALALDEREYGPSHPAVTLSLDVMASAELSLGHPAEALALRERQLAIAEKVEGGAVAAALGGVGNDSLARGDHRRAAAVFRRQLTIAREKSEPSLIADALGNLAELSLAEGRPTDAQAHLRKALELRERSYPAEHRLVALALTQLGEAELLRRDAGAALPLLERALAAREHKLEDPTNLARIRFALARALWETGGDRKRAVELAASAHVAFSARAAGFKRQLLAVGDWLAHHRAP